MSVERGEDITLRFSLKGAKSAKALIYEYVCVCVCVCNENSLLRIR